MKRWGKGWILKDIIPPQPCDPRSSFIEIWERRYSLTFSSFYIEQLDAKLTQFGHLEGSNKESSLKSGAVFRRRLLSIPAIPMVSKTITENLKKLKY